MKVSVCIATYRRTERLRAVLEDLARQSRLPDQVVVVDNDLAGSARPSIEQVRASGAPFVIVYDVQPERNIAMTRNRTVSLADGDSVISLAILRPFDATSEERLGYLKMRRAMAGEIGEEPNGGEAEGDGEAETNGDAALSPERYAQMSAAEQTILTVSENGFGKRTSSFEYRSTGRGGKGIVAMAVNQRNGSLVASFPVEEGDEIMLVTDGGQLIRVPVGGIRVAGRATQGVIVFDTAEQERVVSVERINEPDGEDEEPSEAGD